MSSGCWKYGGQCKGPSVKDKDHLAGLVKETSAVYNIQTEQTLYNTFSALRFWDIFGMPIFIWAVAWAGHGDKRAVYNIQTEQTSQHPIKNTQRRLYPNGKIYKQDSRGLVS